MSEENTGNRVAVVGGTGALGFGLALRWAAAGVDVVIGSRDAGRAQEAADRARDALAGGARIGGADNADAVAQGDTVVLCVPFANQAPTLRAVKEAWRPGTILVDATVPLATAVGGRPTDVLRVGAGSAAEHAATLVPSGVRVVSALHTVSADHLADLDWQLDEDVLVSGDDAEAKAVVAALVETIAGLRPIDVGPLARSRYVECLTPLLIGVNRKYRTHAGIRLTGVDHR